MKPARYEAFTAAELEAIGVRRPSAAGWIACVVLTLVAVFVWTSVQWFDLQRAREFHAFESGLVRICAETRGVYTRGVCKAPDVAVQFTTPDMLPHEERQGHTVGQVPLTQPKEGYSL